MTPRHAQLRSPNLRVHHATNRGTNRGAFCASRAGGVALLLVLIAVATATILTTGFIVSQSTNIHIARNARFNDQARAIAETGIQIAIKAIESDTSWRNNRVNGVWINDETINGGTLNVRVDDGTFSSSTGTVTGDASIKNNPTDSFVITSRGNFGGTSETLRVTATVTAAGGQKLLMAVPNPSSLSAEESAREALLLGWGWNVTSISDSASSAELAAAVAAGNLVVYVPMTASATTLAANLVPLKIGVVSENADFAVPLGVTSAAPVLMSGSQFRVGSFNDYITQVFGPTNTVSISSTQPLQYYTGRASGALSLAAVTNDATRSMLVSVDTAAALTTGTAQGRRVLLPWGQTTFPISSLTNSGRLVLQRSLEWAGGSQQAATNTGIAVNDYVSMSNAATIDAYRSANGAYGGSNAGLNATVATNSILGSRIVLKNTSRITGNAQCGPGGTPSSVIVPAATSTITGTRTALTATNSIPSVTIPLTVPAVSGSPSLSSGTTTWSTDQHFNKLTLRSNAIVDVTAKINVVCDSTVSIGNSAQIRIQPGGELNLYCKGSLSISSTASINANSGNPALCKIMFPNTSTMTMSNTSAVHANVTGVMSTLNIRHTAQFYGTFQGRRLAMTTSTAPAFHQDLSGTQVGGGAVSATIIYSYNYSYVE
jgi:hypothetical protein